MPLFAEDERLRSQKAEGSNYKEVDKSAEYFGTFPELGRLKFKVAKAFSMKRNKIPERRDL